MYLAQGIPYGLLSISLPSLRGPMLRMVDPVQKPVWYEPCGSCHGTFFDAGEYRHPASFTAADLYRRWNVPERA
jgi:hypothetical protein